MNFMKRKLKRTPVFCGKKMASPESKPAASALAGKRSPASLAFAVWAPLPASRSRLNAPQARAPPYGSV